MALELDKIEAEIAKLQKLINMNDGKILKARKQLDVLKSCQNKLVGKKNQLRAAKVNIEKFNKD